MQKMRICLLAMFVVLLLGMAGCGSEPTLSEVTTPIQMQVSTEHLHPRMGLSGFILGTFMLLNAYIVILLSCAALIIKDSAFKKTADTLRLGLQMLNPEQGGKGMLLKVLDQLSSGDTRFRIGTAGLIIGVVLAYIGAWIAV